VNYLFHGAFSSSRRVAFGLPRSQSKNFVINSDKSMLTGSFLRAKITIAHVGPGTLSCSNGTAPIRGLSIENSLDGKVSDTDQKTTECCRGPPGSSEIPTRFVKHDFRVKNPTVLWELRSADNGSRNRLNGR
jgi:hypothetical protein